MAELKNTFTWSFSAARDFEECRRRRYWAKYAMWGGWQKDATPLQKTAYRLTKMENQFSLKGNAVEKAVMWVLHKKQEGTDVTADEAYETVARPFLNNAWMESKKRMWELNPKKHCCLLEHYYNKLDTESQKALTERIINDTRKCIENFISLALPRLATVKPEQETPIATASAGDPEHFMFEGIKVYAIPDYVFATEGVTHIHDWKSGKPKEQHKDQLALYGLWGHLKHQLSPENIRLHIEYLLPGLVESAPFGEQDINSVSMKIKESVADMAEYLVDADTNQNQPLPQAEWDMAADPKTCGMCNFFELCKPELGDSFRTT